MYDHHLTERIVVSNAICHGKPRIAGTRILVYHVLDLIAGGVAVEAIASEDYFPDITREDVLACVAYACEIVQSTFSKFK